MGEVLAWRRRPVRAIVIREHLGEAVGLHYRFLIAECVIGKKPAQPIYGEASLSAALGRAKLIAAACGLPIVREFGNSNDPQPPVAA